MEFYRISWVNLCRLGYGLSRVGAGIEVYDLVNVSELYNEEKKEKKKRAL
jgi:hypothetical protein